MVEGHSSLSLLMYISLFSWSYVYLCWNPPLSICLDLLPNRRDLCMSALFFHLSLSYVSCFFLVGGREGVSICFQGPLQMSALFWSFKEDCFLDSLSHWNYPLLQKQYIDCSAPTTEKKLARTLWRETLSTSQAVNNLSEHGNIWSSFSKMIATQEDRHTLEAKVMLSDFAQLFQWCSWKCQVGEGLDLAKTQSFHFGNI